MGLTYIFHTVKKEVIIKMALQITLSCRFYKHVQTIIINVVFENENIETELIIVMNQQL